MVCQTSEDSQPSLAADAYSTDPDPTFEPLEMCEQTCVEESNTIVIPTFIYFIKVSVNVSYILV